MSVNPEEIEKMQEKMGKGNHKKNNEPLKEKWWLWMILAIVGLSFALGIPYVTINSKETTSNSIDSAKVSSNNTIQEEKYEAIKESPYKLTNDYDGIYKFSLSDDNGAGHIFTGTGAIEIKGGKCKIKYSTSSDTLAPNTREYNGFCGFKEDTFYIMIIRKTSNNSIYGDAIYKCNLGENKNLSCILDGDSSNLVGCYGNKNLDLTFVESAQNIDDVVTQIIAEEKAKKEEEERLKKEQEEIDFKENCQIYTYEEMARNPDKFKGSNVKVTGKVVQALYGTYSVDLRVNITKKGNYSTYYTDTIYVTYTPQKGEDKILENDIITLWGTSEGDYSYTSTIGAKITLPHIKAKYIEINK